MSVAKLNDTVRVNYTGKLSNGEVFDSSEGSDPLEFTLGKGQLIPGFENGVIDMKVKETKVVEIPCTEAYGDYRDDLLQEVPKNLLPTDINPEVGMGLMSQTPDGNQLKLVVSEVKAESIVVDANHPLAGKDLIFEIELLEIL